MKGSCAIGLRPEVWQIHDTALVASDALLASVAEDP